MSVKLPPEDKEPDFFRNPSKLTMIIFGIIAYLFLGIVAFGFMGLIKMRPW